MKCFIEFYKENPDFNDPLLYHRVIEAQKFAYARRTELGDVDFVYHTRELLANMTERLVNFYDPDWKFF